MSSSRRPRLFSVGFRVWLFSAEFRVCRFIFSRVYRACRIWSADRMFAGCCKLGVDRETQL